MVGLLQALLQHGDTARRARRQECIEFLPPAPESQVGA